MEAKKKEQPCKVCGSLGAHKHYHVLIFEAGQKKGLFMPTGNTTTDPQRAGIYNYTKAQTLAREISDSSKTIRTDVVPYTGKYNK